MELRQLIYFDAVARLGGFSRAAEHLHVAQPAISVQVRRLESELGVELLRRTTRRVGLTPAGELFAVRAARVLAEVDQARAELLTASAVLRGALRIGATPVLGGIDLPAALAGFRGRYPAITIRLRSGLLGSLLEDLDAGRLDVVLGPLHPDLPDRYAAEVIAEESLVLAVPPGSPLTGEGPVPLAEMADEAFVCLPAGSGLHRILHRAAAEAGFVPRVEFEVDTPSGVRDMVSAGLGVALLASSLARGPGAPVRLRALAEPPAHPPIGVIRLAASPAPLVPVFIAHLHGRGA